MDIRLTPEDAELQARARAFCEQVLIPLEDECEEHDGLTPESLRRREAAGARARLHRDQPRRSPTAARATTPSSRC